MRTIPCYARILYGTLVVLTGLVLAQPALANAPAESVGETNAIVHDDTVVPAQPNVEALERPAKRPPFDPSFYQPLPLPLSLPPVANPTLRPPGEMITYDLRTGQETRGGLPPDVQSSLEEAMRSGALGDLFQYPEPNGPQSLQKNFTGLSWVSNTTTGRFPTHVKLFMNVRDINGVLRGFVCSGTMIDPQHVITAGHCVYFHDDNNGNTYNNWAESIRVVPAYNNGVEPYGDANAVQMHSWTGWTANSNFDHDIGIIDLNRPVGALTGWRGYGWYNGCGSFTSGSWEHNGYPAASPFNGQFMYRNTGSFDSCETVLGIWTGNEVRFNAQSWGGQSGSGAVTGDVVRAVLSNGTSTYTDDVRLTSDKFTTIGAWISADVPASVDFVALDTNIAPASINSGSALSTLNFLVHNYSTVSWSGQVNFDVYLSTNNFISTADTKLSSQSFTWSFASKSSVRVNAGVPTIPASMSTGSYWVGVIITNADASASNNDSSGDDAAPISVTCPAPGAATLFSPTNGANCQNTTVTLDWSTVSGATSYQVQVGSSCGIGSVFTTASSFYSYTTSPGVTRWWRVRARNACGVYGPWTSCFRLTTSPAAPATPVLASPANGVICQPLSGTLRWNSVTGATNYQVQMGSACGTGTIVTTTATPSYIYAGLSPSMTRYWRVRARNACGTYGPWSACFSFSTPQAPMGIGPNITSVNPQSSLKILVLWDKDLDPASATTAANYTVHETGNPANSIPVLVVVQIAPAQIIVKLTAPWDPAICYTVTGQNIGDLCGNLNGVDSGDFSASFASTQGCRILVCPRGDGDLLQNLSCDLVYSARDASGNPITGLTAADFVLDGCIPADIAMCANGLPSFTETAPGSGDYIFSGAIGAGGWTDAGLSLSMTTQCVTNSCLNISVRSPDLTADGLVDLVDVGAFAVDFFAGATRADLSFDGTLDLVDVGLFAPHVGHGPCALSSPGPALAAVTPSDQVASLSLSFAKDSVVTEVPEDADAAAGVTVYLIARSTTAVRAWQAQISVDEGILVLGRSALGGAALDIDDEADRWQVGLAQAASPQSGFVVLASYELSVVDAGSRELSLHLMDSADESILASAYVPDTTSTPRVTAFRIENSSLQLVPRESVPTYSGPSTILAIAPNPFNPSTEIRFYLDQPAGAQLRIYDITGRLVESVEVGELGRGTHAWTWLGRDRRDRSVASGVYTVRLVAIDKTTVQRITLMK